MTFKSALARYTTGAAKKAARREEDQIGELRCDLLEQLEQTGIKLEVEAQ
jgi:hypothetical protein